MLLDGELVLFVDWLYTQALQVMARRLNVPRVLYGMSDPAVSCPMFDP